MYSGVPCLVARRSSFQWRTGSWFFMTPLGQLRWGSLIGGYLWKLLNTSKLKWFLAAALFKDLCKGVSGKFKITELKRHMHTFHGDHFLLSPARATTYSWDRHPSILLRKLMGSTFIGPLSATMFHRTLVSNHVNNPAVPTTLATHPGNNPTLATSCNNPGLFDLAVPTSMSGLCTWVRMRTTLAIFPAATTRVGEEWLGAHCSYIALQL